MPSTFHAEAQPLTWQLLNAPGAKGASRTPPFSTGDKFIWTWMTCFMNVTTWEDVRLTAPPAGDILKAPEATWLSVYIYVKLFMRERRLSSYGLKLMSQSMKDGGYAAADVWSLAEGLKYAVTVKRGFLLPHGLINTNDSVRDPPFKLTYGSSQLVCVSCCYF